MTNVRQDEAPQKTNLTTENCDFNENCVRFCCDDNSACLNETFFNLNLTKEAKNLNLSFKVLSGRPKCGSMFEEDEGIWEFLSDGKVVQIVDDARFVNDHTQYCFDRTNDKNRMLICYGDEADQNEEDEIPSEAIYPIWMLISIPFLLVTFLIYACIRELRKLHGKAVMCYILALIFVYVSIALIRLNNEELFKTPWMCKSAGYFAYISTLFCFFWLNVMSYDVFSTFRTTIRNQYSERRTFFLYCAYAFGTPLFLTLVVFVIDTTKTFPEEFLPLMGVHRCWIQKTRLIEAVYVYVPITLIIAVNTLFYVITSYKIHKVQAETAVVRGGESSRHSKTDLDRARFVLYLRLFVITGVTWTIDLISWILQSSNFLHFFNILNCLQGLLIFILFVCKSNVKNLVRRRWIELRRSEQSNFSRYNSATASASLTSSLNISRKPVTIMKSSQDKQND